MAEAIVHMPYEVRHMAFGFRIATRRRWWFADYER